MHLPAQRKISRASALRTPQLLEKKCSRKKRSPAGRFLARKSISLITLLAEPDAFFSRPSRRGPVATTTRLVGRRRVACSAGFSGQRARQASSAHRARAPPPSARVTGTEPSITRRKKKRGAGNRRSVTHARLTRAICVPRGGRGRSSSARSHLGGGLGNGRQARKAPRRPHPTLARGSLLVAAQHHAGGQAAPTATAPPRTGRPDQDQAAVLHAHGLARDHACAGLWPAWPAVWAVLDSGRPRAEQCGSREEGETRAARVNAPATWIWGGSRHADLALPTR